jgi:hypothetical protein
MNRRRRLGGLAMGLAALPLGAVGTSAAGPAQPGLVTAFEEQTLTNPVYTGADTGPSVRVGRDGTVYISAVRGTPNGMDLWRADRPGGPVTYASPPDTLVPRECCAAPGGQDVDLEVTDAGLVGVSDNWSGSVTVGVSSDRGRTFRVQPLGGLVPGDDRQWMTSDGRAFYMGFHDLLTGDIVVERSVAGADGLVYVPTSTGILGAADPATTDLEPGNLLADRRRPGLLYQVYTSGSTEAAPRTAALGTVSTHQDVVRMATSLDGGVSWRKSTVLQGPAGTSYAALFPAAAVDRSGNVFVAVSDRTDVLVLHSTDRGATWSAPVKVNRQPGAAVLPWIAAGGDGGVVVAWFGASTLDPGANADRWQVFAAESLDSLAPSPTYRTFTVSDHVVHTGPICAGPVGDRGPCQGEGRALGDYFQVALDPDGVANLAWSDDSVGAPSRIHYARGGLRLGPPN